MVTGQTDIIDRKLNSTRTINDIFKNAQRAFNIWSKFEPIDRTTDKLLKMLDFDFFEVLDSITIARSRKHIEKYYDTKDIGKFPKRNKPISLRPPLTDISYAINYNEIFEQLMELNLSVYAPTNFIFPSKIEKYVDFKDGKANTLTQEGREKGIRRLTSINLMKRMESSVYSFNLTLIRIKYLIESTIKIIDDFQESGRAGPIDMTDISNVEDFDDDDLNTDFFSVGKKSE